MVEADSPSEESSSVRSVFRTVAEWISVQQITGEIMNTATPATIDNIQRFKNYLEKKGYANCQPHDFSEDMHGVRCLLICDPRSVPNAVRNDFTQVIALPANVYNVRLGVVDFNNESITQNLF